MTPERCGCCGDPAPLRGEADPWEGRLDGYCEDCAHARCDAYPGDCGKGRGAVPHSTPDPVGDGERWRCAECGTKLTPGSQACHDPAHLQTVIDSERAERDRLREALNEAGEFLAVLVSEMTTANPKAAREIERAALNPIQRALGVHVSEVGQANTGTDDD